MKDRDYLWCLVHMLLDQEEQLEHLCPACRASAGEDCCPACGTTKASLGDGGDNPAFDPARYAQLKGGRGG